MQHTIVCQAARQQDISRTTVPNGLQDAVVINIHAQSEVAHQRQLISEINRSGAGDLATRTLIAVDRATAAQVQRDVQRRRAPDKGAHSGHYINASSAGNRAIVPGQVSGDTQKTVYHQVAAIERQAAALEDR